MSQPEEALKIATALRHAGRLDESRQTLLRFLEAQPGNALAWHELALIAWQMRRTEEAVTYFTRALQIQPDFVEAHNNLGTVAESLNRLEEAAAHYRRATEIAPQLADAHYNLANVLKRLTQHDEAVSHYRLAVALCPTEPDFLNNLGNALKDGGQLDEAELCYRRALEAKPEMAFAANNLGNVLLLKLQFKEAEFWLRRAVELRNDNADAFHNLAHALREQGDFKGAIENYDRALELDPKRADTRFSRATLWLLQGEFEKGWSEYGWRWKPHLAGPSDCTLPVWKGENLAGKKILLHCEQGFGDIFQFVRYAAVLKEKGATVALRCVPQITPLLRSCSEIDQFVDSHTATGLELRASEGAEFDYHALLLDLPGVLQTTTSTIPVQVPYLLVDPELVGSWRNRLKLTAPAEFQIGINWRGRSGDGLFRQRDIPLEQFLKLLEIPGVRLISLQKDGQPALSEKTPGIVAPDDDFDTASGAFMDTAAIMASLDLVITSDTSVAHLAGALGVPVWVALPFVPEWRWLLNRPDSPWYPTMRLFRQKAHGDWAGVFEGIKSELANLIATSATVRPYGQ